MDSSVKFGCDLYSIVHYEIECFNYIIIVFQLDTSFDILANYTNNFWTHLERENQKHFINNETVFELENCKLTSARLPIFLQT
jgi:hypothetical protein